MPDLLSPSPQARPPALVVAAALLVLESLAALVFAILELAATRSSRLVVGLGTGVLMLGLAALLLVLARAVLRSRRWSRGLAVVIQLIVLLLGWSFREPPTTAAGIALGLVSLAALVCLLLPASTRAFLGAGPPD